MSQAGRGDSLPTFHTADAASTVALGRELASGLKPGDVVAFYGELGAGKTTMIKGVCAGLGVTEVVKSPSFVIATEYTGSYRQGRQEIKGADQNEPPRTPRAPSPNRNSLPVYHIDLYRIGAVQSPESRVQSPNELEGIDFEGYLEAGGVCLIEWAERAEALLPARTIRVRLSLEGRGRRIEVERPG